MKNIITSLFVSIALPLVTFSRPVDAPVLRGSDTLIVSAYNLAVKTVFQNISSKGIINAGAEYGGEWTRDIAINTRNACNLICPEESVRSLWAVTRDGGTRVGHQYWDKIIWVPAAYEQLLAIGNDSLLVKTYRCSANTMKELEESVFDSRYGLFNGGSVFNDGISAYEEPVYDPNNNSGGIIDHPCNTQICCLSTNCIYTHAYSALARMASRCGDHEAAQIYSDKAAMLRECIRARFWNPDKGTLSYLIDQYGDVHHFQEGLGYAFAVLCDILTREEALALTRNAHISRYGIPSVWPDMKRFNSEKPGRHNNIIWPHVNAFYGEAALKAGNPEQFNFELRNMADLALNKSDGHFYEIYNTRTGLPDGGWQKGGNLNSSIDQTWCATGYISLIYRGLWGLKATENGLVVSPDKDLLETNGICSLEGLRYRGCTIDVSRAKSPFKKGIYVNGIKQDGSSVLISPDTSGHVAIVIY